MHPEFWIVSNIILNVVLIIMSQYFRCVHQCSDLLPDTCDASPPFKSGHGSQGSDEQNHGWNGLLSYFFENPHFIQHVKEKLSVLPLSGYVNNIGSLFILSRQLYYLDMTLHSGLVLYLG